MDVQSAKRQRGAEIVEFLIVLPFILIVLLLIIELGIGFANQAILANAARVGAREAANCNGNPTVDPCLTSARQAAARAARSIISLKNSANQPDPLTLQLDNSVASCTASPPEGGCPITATLTYDFEFFLLPAFLSGLTDFQLTARTVMNKLPG
jgi:Flp pilus assembly protein TadG